MTVLTPLITPVALLDRPRLLRNIDVLQRRVERLGVRLRPHVKTAKCLEVARLQRDAGAVGITVSTLKEAETFFAAGFDDILYAVGIAPNKFDAVLNLRRRGCRLTVILDSLQAAAALVAKGRAAGERFAVLIEIDSDGLRAGVKPDDDALLAIGRALHEGGAELAGVMTHCGASYAEHDAAGLERIAEQERERCVRAAERLRVAGLPCPQVSVGSTPTALAARALPGVTEVRAGVYVFHDLVMCNVGVARPEDVALSVLTSVIGHRPDKGRILVDAGWMAMSRDRGTSAQAVDHGYGAVCDSEGRLLDGWFMEAANQEHGLLARRGGLPGVDIVQRFPVGTLLRILPNHACATAAQFDHYRVLDGEGPVRRWERFGGW
jgi:threo-3-hydroxy-D-aspartate ammonia-lyase